jgi:hypothetical protein
MLFSLLSDTVIEMVPKSTRMKALASQTERTPVVFRRSACQARRIRGVARVIPSPVPSQLRQNSIPKDCQGSREAMQSRPFTDAADTAGMTKPIASIFVMLRISSGRADPMNRRTR